MIGFTRSKRRGISPIPSKTPSVFTCGVTTRISPDESSIVFVYRWEPQHTQLRFLTMNEIGWSLKVIGACVEAVASISSSMNSKRSSWAHGCLFGYCMKSDRAHGWSIVRQSTVCHVFKMLLQIVCSAKRRCLISRWIATARRLFASLEMRRTAW